MKFIKVFKEEFKRDFYLLFLSGVVLPILIPVAFGILGNSDIPNFVLYLVSLFTIFGFLVFPCLCRIHYYSIFYYRLIIFIGMSFPLLLSLMSNGSLFLQSFEKLKIFIISAGLFWLLVTIFLWIYDGYLKSKKTKTA